jgi:3-keto-5-aminohexanoate cleavage enzyme
VREPFKEGVIINFTPNGMLPTKQITPHVPISPQEIIKDVLLCAQLGANVIHLHARDQYGEPTYKKDIYKEIILGIREKRNDLIIGVSCSGRNFSEFEKRSEVLELDDDAKPDMASLTLSSLNFNKIASVNSPDMIQRLASRMLERGIKPELEVFDFGMINYASYLIRKELIKPPYYFNIILGNIACAQATPLHAGLLLNDLPQDSLVTLGGVGAYQHDINILGLLFADGCRVGIEDNIYFDQKREKLATNAQFVGRIVDHAALLERKIASPAAVRKRLGLCLQVKV